MKCHRCGGDFPMRQGRFCGTCLPPSLVDTLADVLVELLSENAHQLVGGEAFARDAIERIQRARKQVVP